LIGLGRYQQNLAEKLRRTPERGVTSYVELSGRRIEKQNMMAIAERYSMVVVARGCSNTIAIVVKSEGTPERAYGGPERMEPTAQGGAVVGVSGTGYEAKLLCRFKPRPRGQKIQVVRRSSERKPAT
jgi:hypothetical protein